MGSCSSSSANASASTSSSAVAGRHGVRGRGSSAVGWGTGTISDARPTIITTKLPPHTSAKPPTYSGRFHTSRLSLASTSIVSPKRGGSGTFGMVPSNTSSKSRNLHHAGSSASNNAGTLHKPRTYGSSPGSAGHASLSDVSGHFGPSSGHSFDGAADAFSWRSNSAKLRSARQTASAGTAFVDSDCASDSDDEDGMFVQRSPSFVSTRSPQNLALSRGSPAVSFGQRSDGGGSRRSSSSTGGGGGSDDGGGVEWPAGPGSGTAPPRRKWISTTVWQHTVAAGDSNNNHGTTATRNRHRSLSDSEVNRSTRSAPRLQQYDHNDSTAAAAAVAAAAVAGAAIGYNRSASTNSAPPRSTSKVHPVTGFALRRHTATGQALLDGSPLRVLTGAQRLPTVPASPLHNVSASGGGGGGGGGGDASAANTGKTWRSTDTVGDASSAATPTPAEEEAEGAQETAASAAPAAASAHPPLPAKRTKSLPPSNLHEQRTRPYRRTMRLPRTRSGRADPLAVAGNSDAMAFVDDLVPQAPFCWFGEPSPDVGGPAWGLFVAHGDGATPTESGRARRGTGRFSDVRVNLRPQPQQQQQQRPRQQPRRHHRQRHRQQEMETAAGTTTTTVTTSGSDTRGRRQHHASQSSSGTITSNSSSHSILAASPSLRGAGAGAGAGAGTSTSDMRWHRSSSNGNDDCYDGGSAASVYSDDDYDEECDEGADDLDVDPMTITWESMHSIAMSDLPSASTHRPPRVLRELSTSSAAAPVVATPASPAV